MDEEEIKRLLAQRAMKKLDIARRAREIVIEVITSPGCPYCPRAVEMAKRLTEKYGVVSRELSTSTPEGMEKAARHHIMGTPTVLINDEVVFIGVPEFDKFEEEIRRRLHV